MLKNHFPTKYLPTQTEISDILQVNSLRSNSIEEEDLRKHGRKGRKCW